MEIKYTMEGFLKDAVYSAGIREFMLSYADKFPGIETLILKVADATYDRMGTKDMIQPFIYSADKKELTISTNERIYADKKGRHNILPSQQSYYMGLRSLFDNAVENHKLKNT